MEYASGGTLFERIEKFQRFKEDIARYFFQQLVCGVAWMHKKARLLFLHVKFKGLPCLGHRACLCARFVGS